MSENMRFKKMSLHEENRMLKQLLNSARLCFDEGEVEELDGGRMTENKQYITNNPHNKSYIFCDSVRLNNIEVAKTLNELVTKCNTLTNENDRLKKENDQLKRKIGKVY